MKREKMLTGVLLFSTVNELRRQRPGNGRHTGGTSQSDDVTQRQHSATLLSVRPPTCNYIEDTRLIPIKTVNTYTRMVVRRTSTI